MRKKNEKKKGAETGNGLLLKLGHDTMEIVS